MCFTCDQPDVIHHHPIDGHDLHRGCGTVDYGLEVADLPVVAVEGQGDHLDHGKGTVPAEGSCGELVGYVDDGAYSYAHTSPVVLS